MQDKLIEVRGVTVGYGNIQVLNGLDLSLDCGERIGIFGPNGHGKARSWKPFQGLIKPWKGEILLKGEVINAWSPRRILESGVVHVCQGNTSFPG